MESSFFEDLCQFVQCSLCNQTLQEPKLLQCFHTFCKSCIQRHAQPKEQGTIFKCPKCSSETLLQQLSDVENLQPSPLHSRMLQVLAFTDLKKENLESIVRRQSPCETHSSHTLILFCKKCDVLVCLLCLKDDHNGHETQTLKEVTAIKKDLLSKNLEEIEKLQSNEMEMKRQEEIAINMIKDGENAKKDVQKMTQKLVKCLLDQEQQLLNEIQRSVAKADRNLHIIRHTPAAKEYIKSIMANGIASFEDMVNYPKTFSYNPFKLVTSGILFCPNDDVNQQVTNANYKLGHVRFMPGACDEERKTKETIRKFRSILNKLTPQKFQTLMQQILDLHIDTAERLEEIINITFEKAISEPAAFSVPCANMCRCLVPTNVKVETEDGKDKTLTFRKLLLNKCQKEYEKEKSDENTINEKMEQLLKEGLSEDVLKIKKAELSAEELRGRKRKLGNIRFIGELFKLKMLTENIMHDCVIKLIKNNEEESYECLCKLLSTIGKDLDHPKAKPRMDQYFEQIKKVIDLKMTSVRCRFMLQDVIDLRNNNWVPQRDDKEVAEEEKKTKSKIQQSRQSKRDAPNKGHDDRRPRPSGGGVPQADETWTTVPNRTRNVNVDPKKFQDAKKRTNVDTESISLGPGGRGPGAWARGKSGGLGPASLPAPQNTEQETRGNRFSALGGEGRRGPGASRQGPGAGRLGTAGGRRPMQGDREKALEAVRNAVQAKPPPRQEERDTGSPRLEDTESVTPSPPAVSPPVKQLSDADIRIKAMGLADEYFDIKDLKEAMLCVEELESCYHQQLVYHCFNHCLEKHSSERLAIAKLMFSLRKNNVLSEDNYLKGLKQLLGYAEEMEIDIPHVWKYFGELIGPLILDNVLPLSVIKDCSVTLITSKSKQAKLMVEILITAAKVASQEEVASLWSKSGLTFDIFFSSSDETQQFIKDKNIESIVSARPKPKPHSAKIQEELRNLVLTKKANNEEVFKWIDTNVPEPKEPKFIRALVTAVCEDCKTGSASGSEDSCDTSLFTRRSSLLKKYIDDNSSLELQALFALQALSVQLDHPPDFLKSFFNALYDEDVITEDAFFAWEKDTDPNEAQGKGTALSSTTEHFFDWLRSAEEEKTDEG